MQVCLVDSKVVSSLGHCYRAGHILVAYSTPPFWRLNVNVYPSLDTSFLLDLWVPKSTTWNVTVASTVCIVSMSSSVKESSISCSGRVTSCRLVMSKEESYGLAVSAYGIVESPDNEVEVLFGSYTGKLEICLSSEYGSVGSGSRVLSATGGRLQIEQENCNAIPSLIACRYCSRVKPVLHILCWRRSHCVQHIVS